jgi:hypothetical protein
MANYVNSQELEWKHADLSFLGVTIRGLRGFKYKKSTESEHLFAAGDQPVGIQTGNKKIEGSIKLLKSELDRLNKAARAAGYADFSEVPYQVITATFHYKEAFGREKQTDVISGIKFTEFEKGMEQGAKLMEIDCPFIALSLKSV